jgi:hypothetical protein
MFFRTNQQDLSRLTDVQLLVSQKLGDRHQFKAGGSWVNNWFQQPDRKTFYGFRTGDNQLLMSYGGNNLIRQYLDLSGVNYFFCNGRIPSKSWQKTRRQLLPCYSFCWL